MRAYGIHSKHLVGNKHVIFLFCKKKIVSQNIN